MQSIHALYILYILNTIKTKEVRISVNDNPISEKINRSLNCFWICITTDVAIVITTEFETTKLNLQHTAIIFNIDLLIKFNKNHLKPSKISQNNPNS